MAGRTGTVKLSIVSTFDERGAKRAERAIADFQRKFEVAEGSQAVALARASMAWDQKAAAAERAGARMQAVGQKMTNVGNSLTRGLTLPVLAVGAVMTKTSIDFESAFAGVRKTVDATEEQFDELRTGIRNMALELPATREEIAGVAEAAGQLGIETKNILGFTRVMIDLGESTDLAASDAATSLAQLANITGMSQDEFSNLGSSVVALGNNMATTESKIVEMTMRIAGAGKQVGMSEDQMLALAASLSSVGIEAEAGGSAISKTMIEIASNVETGGDKLSTFAEVSGMTSAEFTKAWKEDATGALLAFITGLGDMQEQGGSTLGMLEELGITEVRQRDALLRAAGASDLFAEALNISSGAWRENTALAKEAEQRYATTGSQLAIAKNHVTDIALEFGDALAPALIDAVEAAKPLLEWAKAQAQAFSALDEDQQQQILMWAGIVAAIGPVLSVTGTIVTAVSGAISIYGAYTGALAAHTASQAAAAAATTASTTAMAGLTAATAVSAATWTAGVAIAGALGYALGNAAIDALGLRDDLEALGETIGESEWAMKMFGGEIAQTADLTAEQIELDKKLGLERDENNTLTAESIAKLRDYNDRMRGSSSAIGEAAAATSNLSGATYDATVADLDATIAKDDLVRAMDGQMVAADSLAGQERTLAEMVNDAAQADIAAADALDAYNTAVKERGTESREAESAALRLEDATWRAADANADLKVKQDDITNSNYLSWLGQARDRARELASALGNASYQIGAIASKSGGGGRALKYGTGGYVDYPHMAIVGDEPEYIINPKAPNAMNLLGGLLRDMGMSGGSAASSSVTSTVSNNYTTVAASPPVNINLNFGVQLSGYKDVRTFAADLTRMMGTEMRAAGMAV